MLFFMRYSLSYEIEVSYVVQVRAEGPKAPSPGRVGQNLQKFSYETISCMAMSVSSVGI